MATNKFKRQQPMDYLLDQENQDQKNIFDTSPAKTAPVVANLFHVIFDPAISSPMYI